MLFKFHQLQCLVWEDGFGGEVLARPVWDGKVGAAALVCDPCTQRQGDLMTIEATQNNKLWVQ